MRTPTPYYAPLSASLPKLRNLIFGILCLSGVHDNESGRQIVCRIAREELGAMQAFLCMTGRMDLRYRAIDSGKFTSAQPSPPVLHGGFGHMKTRHEPASLNGD